ncbi:MAG: tetratricopeptide repeat protein, partial [Bacteroidota bacterium]
MYVKQIKVAFLLFIGLLFTTSINAQRNPWENPKYGPDSASRMQCAMNLSTMSEFVKINLFDRAYDSWAYVYENCPSASKNIYIQGVKIVKSKIENAATEEEKNKYIDMLMDVYDQRIEHYKQTGFVLGRKGIDLIKYRNSDVQQAYDYLKESISLLKYSAEDAVIVTFIQLGNVLYKNDAITAQQFADDYFTTAEYASIKHEKKPRAQTNKAIETIEKIFMDSGAPDCEMLVDYFQPKFEDNPTEVEMLKKITEYLREFKCTENELFAQAAENLFEKEPSAVAAYNLARLFYTKENYDKSVDYYERAIDLGEDPEPKAKYYYELGVIKSVRYQQHQEARSLALKALEIKPNWGDPYILIGNTYAASSKDCGENKFQNAAVFWAAVDKYQKAKAVDPSVADQANDLIQRYSQYFPNNEDAFFYGFTDGQEYKVGCWINETTT